MGEEVVSCFQTVHTKIVRPKYKGKMMGCFSNSATICQATVNLYCAASRSIQTIFVRSELSLLLFVVQFVAVLLLVLTFLVNVCEF
eukprot:2896580-Amphidinium_carterae.1